MRCPPLSTRPGSTAPGRLRQSPEDAHFRNTANARQKLRLLTAFTLAVFLLACNSKESLVTVEPTKTDIAGRYQLSSWSFSEIANSEISAKAALAYIELREDGSVTFHEVPVVPDSDSQTFSVQKFHSGDGTYVIAPLGSTSKSEFYGLYIDCGNLPDPVDTPKLRTNGDSLTLSFEYFDGDFVQRMAFKRDKKIETAHGGGGEPPHTSKSK